MAVNTIKGWLPGYFAFINEDYSVGASGVCAVQTGTHDVQDAAHANGFPFAYFGQIPRGDLKGLRKDLRAAIDVERRAVRENGVARRIVITLAVENDHFLPGAGEVIQKLMEGGGASRRKGMPDSYGVGIVIGPERRGDQ